MIDASFIAVVGKSPKEVLRALGLRSTGNVIDSPDAPLVGCHASNDWYLVRADEGAFALDVPEDLAAGSEVITCSADGESYLSWFVHRINNERRFTVEHDGEVSRDHLDVEGEPPVIFDEIVEGWSSRLNDEKPSLETKDPLFNVPIDLAHAVVGYHLLDETKNRETGLRFEILAES